jgi:hypothetical protein
MGANGLTRKETAHDMASMRDERIAFTLAARQR